MEGVIKVTLARDPRGETYGTLRHFHRGCVPESWYERRDIDLRMYPGMNTRCCGCGRPFTVFSVSFGENIHRTVGPYT